MVAAEFGLFHGSWCNASVNRLGNVLSHYIRRLTGGELNVASGKAIVCSPLLQTRVDAFSRNQAREFSPQGNIQLRSLLGRQVNTI